MVSESRINLRERCLLTDAFGERISVNTVAVAEIFAAKANALMSRAGIEGPYTSWWHMFGWNTFGILLFGPAVATHRFFQTLNGIEAELNRRV